MRASSPMDALLDPEVIGNVVLIAVSLISLFVVQKWVDKHRPRR